MSKVAILVPIYGVEKFIERCLHSLFNQTFADIEYVFVNDCTKDNSMLILKSTIEKYPHLITKIKIINHECNKGLSEARNTAIKSATSEYVMHVDSDDYIEKNAIELMYYKAIEEKSDIVVSDFTYVYKENYVKQKFEVDCSSNMAYFTQLIEKKTPSFVCNKLIKLNLYLDNNIYVPNGVNFMEDYSVLPKLVYYSNVISKVDLPLYYYLQNSASYCNSLNKESVDSAFKSLNIIREFVKQNKVYDLYRDKLNYGWIQTKYMLSYASPSNAEYIFTKFKNSNEYNFYNSFNYKDRILLWFLNYKMFYIFKLVVVLNKKLGFLKNKLTLIN